MYFRFSQSDLVPCEAKSVLKIRNKSQTMFLSQTWSDTCLKGRKIQDQISQFLFTLASLNFY